MSLPSFPDNHRASPTPDLAGPPSSGSGDRLPFWLLALCCVFTAIATGVSVMSITLQLKNYRKPALQRAVVRIMLMVPLYAISSLIAIFSLEAAFFIDAIRDLYEAFVIYTFFQLLITYLGGERSLLIILHGRPPIPHPFPFNLFLRPMDVSDPWTLLNLKRGVLQYVQIKPLLVIATVVLKATGTYQEGRFALNSGYTYVSIVYNASICLSLYCLAMFWVCVSKDLKPFRPVPKFLCVKGILFFSFWQGIFVSFLVAVGAIKRVGVYTDPEHMSLALVDSLICFEMPIFAVAHQYAFQASDYIDDSLVHAARLPFLYAFRDAFGFKDVWEDIKDTFKGRGVSYQAYEPAEGTLHYGIGRQKRIRAGLRYSKGGQAKYWIPVPGDETRIRIESNPVTALKRRVDERLAQREGYAPLLPKQAAHVVRADPERTVSGLYSSDSDDSDAASLDFSSVNEEEENLYERARRIGYAGFPNVDVSKEAKARKLREEEDNILAGRRPGMGRERTGSGVSRGKGKGKESQPKRAVYGAWADRESPASKGPKNTATARDLVPDAHYDGDTERPDAWRADQNAQSTGQMRWTKKAGQKPNSGPKLEQPTPVRRQSSALPSSNPFALGNDDESSEHSGAVTPSDRPLPPDARDLVVDDESRVEAARVRGRIRGEPQTKSPVHIYVHNDPKTNQPQEVEEVYTTAIDAEQVNGEGRKASISSDFEEGKVPGGAVAERMLRVEESPERVVTPVRPPPDEDNPWA